MIAIGRGVAAGFQDDRLVVIAGTLFAEIERERRDGPRWCEALRGARYMAHMALRRTGIAWALTTLIERRDGIPAGTFPAVEAIAEYRRDGE